MYNRHRNVGPNYLGTLPKGEAETQLGSFRVWGWFVPEKRGWRHRLIRPSDFSLKTKIAAPNRQFDTTRFSTLFQLI
jgi:hypothetical protein